jgi:hypothetical protein
MGLGAHERVLAAIDGRLDEILHELVALGAPCPCVGKIDALERDLAATEERLDRLTRALDLSNAAGKDRFDELEETFLARTGDRGIAQEAVAAARKCVDVVEAYGKATAEEVVTKRLRVVDEHGRTWVEASDGGIRCAAPDDSGTWVGMSVDVDPYNGRQAGLWLSRRGDIAGSFTTERDAEILDPSDPAATFDIYTAGGSLCERESMPAGS